MLRFRVPASSANLGPGFDTLAVALRLYVEVSAQPADELRITSTGEGREIEADHEHLSARVARAAAGHDRFHFTIHSEIPVSRGLGSSAALAVATAAAVGASDPLAVTAKIEGHAENAAASVLGGLVAATEVGESPVAARLPLDPDLRFVVLVPDRPLATKRAREALPAQVNHSDASFNLGRMGLLLAGLGDHRQLARSATEDRLHQTARTPLFPESTRLMAGLVEAGALASCWSGAGPTLLGFCDSARAAQVREAGDQLLNEVGVAGRSLLLEADTAGLTGGEQISSPTEPADPGLN